MTYTDKTLTIDIPTNGSLATATLTTTTGIGSISSSGVGVAKKKTKKAAAVAAAIAGEKSRPSASRTISVRSVRHGKLPSLKDQVNQEATASWLMDTLSFWIADAMEVAFFGPYDEVR